MTKAATIQTELKRLGDSQIARFSRRFFKTGPGEYGAGDVFRGIRVPVLKRVAKEHRDLSSPETMKLLRSQYHEDRLVALLILNYQFIRGDDVTRKAIYQSYLKSTRFINSWDLVDASAPQIVGAFLWDKDRNELYKLARSGTFGSAALPFWPHSILLSAAKPMTLSRSHPYSCLTLKILFTRR